MSITDIAAGRITQAAARGFGNRRVPPMAVRSGPKPAPFIINWKSGWISLAQLRGRLPELWRHITPDFRRLAGLLLQGITSLPRLPRPRVSLSRDAIVRALLRSAASKTFLRVIAYVGALCLLALPAAHFIRSAPTPVEAGPAAPAAEWMTVAKPFPAFSLLLPELGDSSTGYAMRRHVWGGRQDILTWEDMNGSAPHVMVEVYRPAGEATGFDSAAIEIAARLKNAEAATLKPAGVIDTKFGEMALVEFTIGAARQCLGFARAYTNPQLQILGWHCVSGSAPPTRDIAACALDRLTLLAAGSEPKVRELFARAELKRTFCGQRSHLMAPLPKLGPKQTGR